MDLNSQIPGCNRQVPLSIISSSEDVAQILGHVASLEHFVPRGQVKMHPHQ